MAVSARGKDLLEEFHSIKTAPAESLPPEKGEGGRYLENQQTLEL
jgi:hypothetical protein